MEYSRYSVTFDDQFFKSLNNRWLNNIEIYLLLINIEELLKNSVVQLSTPSEIKENNKILFYYSINNNIPNPQSQNIQNPTFPNSNNINNYFIIPYSNYGDIPKDNICKVRYYNIKIKTIDKIKVISSIHNSEQRRLYFLLDNPKYIFIHYRHIEHKERPDVDDKILLSKININTAPINIINFNPSSIEEDKDNQILFLIIKSKFSIKDLQNLIPYLSISFGNKFVKYNVISESVLSCNIPPQKKKEVIIDIYFSNKNNGCMSKISTYNKENKKSFVYLQKTTENNISNKKNDLIINNSNIQDLRLENFRTKYCETKKYKIFNFGINEIILRIISIFDYLLSHVNYYSNTDSNNISNNNINNINKNENKIDLSLIMINSRLDEGGFNEINLNIILEKVLNELKKINKVYLANTPDEDGYNILHYLSVLNFSKSLIILNNNKISFTEKSNDNLTAYEICAGKRNLDSLLTIIDIMEKQETEEEKIYYDLEVYKSALFLGLEKEATDYDDVQILNALLKQVKIKYMIDSISGKIIDNVHLSTRNVSNGENKNNLYTIKSEIYKKRNVRKIQRAVKCWLRRNKYKSLQKAANTLIEKIKGCCDRKKFLKYKNTTIFIQHEIRNWLKEKHKKNK